MDLEEDIMLSEISQKEKDKYYDFTHIWNLKQTNKQNKNKLRDTKKRLVVTRGERG